MSGLVSYIGGKTHALKQILPYFPVQCRRYYEPFTGGGSVFGAARRRFLSTEFRLNDAAYPIAQLYRAVQQQPYALIEFMDALVIENDLDETRIYAATENWQDAEGLMRPAAFVLTHSAISYSGILTAAFFPNLHTRTGENLCFWTERRRKNIMEWSALLQGVAITQLDYADAIAGATQEDFIYLDPPYVGIHECSYMTPAFDHERLARVLEGIDSRWIMSNNDCEWVRERYAGWRIETPEWRYVYGGGARRSTEVLVFSERVK